MNLENIFVQIPSYIFWKDLNFRLLGYNESFAQVAGDWSVNGIIGKNNYQLAWADSHADFYREGDKAVLDGERSLNVRANLP